MRHLFKREFLAYFNSTIAYIFITVFLVLQNFFFFRGFFVNGILTMRSFFELTPWFFLFFIPAVTMRLWAEEKRTGTNEILYTMPISEWDIVLGKFLGAVVFVAITLLLTINIPVTLGFLGKPDFGPIIGGYLGLLFVASVYIAIGMVASIITTNQIVAYIMGATISFIFFVLGQNFIIFNMPRTIAIIFSSISISTHFNSISRGVLDISDLAYYMGMTVLFLWISFLIIKKRY